MSDDDKPIGDLVLGGDDEDNISGGEDQKVQSKDKEEAEDDLHLDKNTEEEFNKMMKDDLDGKRVPLVNQFLDNPALMGKIGEDNSEEEEDKKEKSVKTKSSKSQSKKGTRMQINAGKEMSRTEKINKLKRQADYEFYQDLRKTDQIPMDSDQLFKHLENIKRKVNEFKQVNRDEELLKMQKQNQEIEAKLNDLKKQDNKELREKQEKCHELVNRLNELFNQRKKEAAEKEKERVNAIQQIKNIQQEQKSHDEEIKSLEEEKKRLQDTLTKLQSDVESYKIYKDFIDQVNAKYSNDNTNQNDLYDNLKEKFEQLMKNENDIVSSIETSRKEQAKIKAEIEEISKKNNKQSQNDKLRELEDDIKKYSEENKSLELQIDTILKEKQRKDSDTHQIKLSIFNLYEKALKAENKQGKIDQKDNYDMDNDDEVSLCLKLDKINETIQDLIKIHESLEAGDKAAEKNK
ncbi:MAG: hypothetical protein MJ252_22470 [archaeon]|nr:hypothetical protein [archaeon]